MFKSPVFNLLLCIATVVLFHTSAVFASDDSAIIAGANTFAQNCAACHGVDAKGREDTRLSKPPSDLTRIRERNNGEFPMTKVYTVIDGQHDAHADGGRVMPIWRSRFLEESIWEGCSQIEDTVVHGKILELLLYLDSIQR